MSGSIPNNVVASNGVGVISDTQANTYVQTDQTAAQLRAFTGNVGMCVILQGLAVAGDGGGGTFYWSSGTYTDDGQNTIVPNGVTAGAWLRAFSVYAAPVYTVAGLPGVSAANQGLVAYAKNGRNTGEGVGAGTGCLVSVNSSGVWAAVWSGVLVTS